MAGDEQKHKIKEKKSSKDDWSSLHKKLHKPDTKKDNTDGKIKGSAWRGMFRKMRLLWPFIWPKNNRWLQLRVVICTLILIAVRVVTVMVPIYQKKIVNSMTLQPVDESVLTDDAHDTVVNDIPVTLTTTQKYTTTITLQGIQFRWDYIIFYIFFRTLRSAYLGNLRTLLWIKVSQNTKKGMRLKLFAHLHNLSLQWHLQRKTGEVLKVMDRGVSSISTVLSHIVFNIIPVFADVIIGVVYFMAVFNVWIGLIVFGAMVGFLVSTVLLTEWRTKFRRQMNDADNEKSAAGVDSILNFETVKYNATEEWEVDRYADVVDKHLDAERTFITMSNMVSVVQQTIISLGLLGGSLLCAWYVYEGRFTVGDYVLFTSYVEHLYGPLGNFGNQYRMIQQAFIDMENMFDMLAEKDKIEDDPDAKPLAVNMGEIEFNHVTFGYQPERTVLHDICFRVPPGQTFALVGHTGSGKSTLLRLLLRFYDVTSGNIYIDGQDLTKVKQKSIRQHVGVVPQDTVLFNKTIRYNVRYGRVDADDEEVEVAATAANIHNRILTFPDGYESKVGERGLKLSGGEKQRVAIARTILKNPAVVLLDEATSALDTKTERTIQSALADICKNRTTLIVAHRLSTIVHADQILVLREGHIIERGSHMELVESGGVYADMWLEQQKEGDQSISEDSVSQGGESDTEQPTDTMSMVQATNIDGSTVIQIEEESTNNKTSMHSDQEKNDKMDSPSINNKDFKSSPDDGQDVEDVENTDSDCFIHDRNDDKSADNYSKEVNIKNDSHEAEHLLSKQSDIHV